MEDLHPKNWLSVYKKKSFWYISMMYLAYSALGLVASEAIVQVEYYAFNYEEPISPHSLISVITAGPFEETLFFGLPFSLSGNQYVVLVSGAIWSSIHLLNTDEEVGNGLYSNSIFAFTIPHIFFSLRAWKSGRGWDTVILHSSWNVIIYLTAVMLGEITFSLYYSEYYGMIEIVGVVFSAILIPATYVLYRRRLRMIHEKNLGLLSYVERKEKSWLWLAFPILFHLIGALISYFAIRHDDPKKARICLYVGVFMFVIQLLIGVFMGIHSFMWI